MSVKEIVIASLKIEEGFVSRPYLDTEGVWTVGYGLNLDDGISEGLAAHILVYLVEERMKEVDIRMPWVPFLSPARQEVYYEMAYQLGVSRFLKFKKMHEAARTGDVPGALREMQDSTWYQQCPERAERMIEKFKRG